MGPCKIDGHRVVKADVKIPTRFLAIKLNCLVPFPLFSSLICLSLFLLCTSPIFFFSFSIAFFDLIHHHHRLPPLSYNPLAPLLLRIRLSFHWEPYSLIFSRSSSLFPSSWLFFSQMDLEYDGNDLSSEWIDASSLYLALKTFHPLHFLSSSSSHSQSSFVSSSSLASSFNFFFTTIAAPPSILFSPPIYELDDCLLFFCFSSSLSFLFPHRFLSFEGRDVKED